MNAVALVTLAAVIQVMAFQWRVGKARNEFGVPGPATSGPETWQRYNRVHLNTVENLVIFFPLLWLCAWFADPRLAAAAGLGFVAARALYSRRYVADPNTRGPAVWLTGFCCHVLLLATVAGIVFHAVR